MGQTISICNFTNLILNLSLGQVVPLYFENHVLPGQCIERSVGKVWFTVNAVQWNKDTEFQLKKSVLPFVPVGVDVVGSIAKVDPDEVNEKRNRKIKKVTGSVSQVILDFVDDDDTDTNGVGSGQSIGRELRAERRGILAGHGTRICVTGGPPKGMVGIDKKDGHQFIRNMRGETFPNLRILVGVKSCGYMETKQNYNATV